MPNESDPTPDYLRPYATAAKAHGGGFRSLLWASTDTQEARFRAFADHVTFKNATVLDVGCGRADLLEFLQSRGQPPKEYIGLEGVPELAAAAEKVTGVSKVIRADFVATPRVLFTGSDVIALSGSLNTAKDVAFYETLRRCFDAAALTFVFNFLSSSYLAGASHLYWRSPTTVEKFCRALTPRVRVVQGYLEGDTTLVLEK